MNHTIRLDIDELLGPPDQRISGDPAASDWDDENRQFRLHYQPVINTGTGRMMAVKALLRWEHPLFGTLSPRRFVPLVLNAGRMLDIGEAVLRRAAIDLRGWQAVGHDGIRIDIELIQSQFYDPQLPGKLRAILAHFDLAPEVICLQISEAILRQNATANLAILEQLAACGVGLALTNFGAGAFAVGALQPFPFGRVNIGAAFVQDMVTIADDAAMGKQIFGALHGFGMRIGADGVETANEYAMLRDYRCDEMQGPYFFRAMPADDIGALLAQGSAPTALALPPHRPRSLLLVDEDAGILAEFKRLLRPGHYNIATAGNGRQALELLELHRFDVILCAQRMTGMSGAEFFAVARQVCPDSARLLLTGSSDVPSAIEAVNAGTADKFLCKPWNDAQLRAHVAQAFRHKELSDENRRLNREVRTAAQRIALLRRELDELRRHIP